MLDWLAERFNDVVDFFWRIFLSFVDFMRDTFWWCLDNLVEISIGFLDGLGGAFDGLNPASYISLIPPETQHLMSITGFNEVMSIIVAAILIRFTLQLIPFVRWGS